MHVSMADPGPVGAFAFQTTTAPFFLTSDPRETDLYFLSFPTVTHTRDRETLANIKVISSSYRRGISKSRCYFFSGLQCGHSAEKQCIRNCQNSGTKLKLAKVRSKKFEIFAKTKVTGT